MQLSDFLPWSQALPPLPLFLFMANRIAKNFTDC
jgi:hypothetical protein